MVFRIQLSVCDDKSANIAKALARIEDVAKDVDIIVLPEVWVGPYDVNKFALFSEPYPGPATTALADV